jgi:hypothetical protein
MNVKEIGSEDVGWIELAQLVDWGDLVNVELNN